MLNTSLLETGKLLEIRFAKVRTVPETQQLHCFHPVSLFKVKVSKFSISTQTRQETVTAEKHVIRFEEVKGYFTVQYGWWWLGMVTSLDQREREVAIDFLNPHGPARSFTYTERPDKTWETSKPLFTLKQQLEET